MNTTLDVQIAVSYGHRIGHKLNVHANDSKLDQNMVMAIGYRNNSKCDIDMSILRVCILGETIDGIVGKTGVSAGVAEDSLARLEKAGLLSHSGSNCTYYFATESGEHFISNFLWPLRF